MVGDAGVSCSEQGGDGRHRAMGGQTSPEDASSEKRPGGRASVGVEPRRVDTSRS